MIVEGIQFLYTVTWKEGWTDRRGRLAFSFQREGWKGGGRHAGFFNLTFFLHDHLVKWQQLLFAGTFPCFGKELCLVVHFDMWQCHC